MTKENKYTRNVRISEKLHEQLKNICDRDGLIMGSFVGRAVKAAIGELDRKQNDTKKKMAR